VRPNNLLQIYICLCLLIGRLAFAAEDAPRPLRFVSDEAYPPISFYYGNHPKGLGVDLARVVADQLGRPLEIDLLPWTEAQTRVSQGGADFLGPMAITPQRRGKYDFTTPFYKFEYVFLVRRDSRGLRAIADLSGKRVGVSAGGYPQQRLKSEAGLNLVVVEDTEEAIRQLRDRSIDAYAVDKWVATYELGLLGVHDVVVGGPPFEVRESALAVEKGNAVLLNDLNKTIASLLQSGAYQKIVDRWQARNVIVLSEEEQKAREQQLQIIGALALLILVVAGAWILFLRRQMALRQVAAQALKTSEERLRLALQATSDVIWDWDVAADAQTWNAAGAEIFGWLDIVEHPQSAAWWVERVHPEDRERIAASFHGVVDDPSQYLWQDEYRFRRLDGSYAEVFDRGHVLRDMLGKAVRMVGAMQDITQRKQNEQALSDSERKFRLLADSSPSGIWRTDALGANTYVSRRWSEITGIGAAEASGKGWNSGVHPDDHQTIYEGWTEAAKHPERGYRSELRVVRPDGRVIWVLCLAAAEFSTSGDLDGWVGTITDITEQKQISMELQASQHLLQSALDSLPSNVAIIDDQGTIVFVNLPWREFASIGLWPHPNHGIGENYLTVCDRAAVRGDTEAGRIAATLRDLLGGRIDCFVHEYNCPDPAGNERWFRMTVNAFVDKWHGIRALIRHSEFTVERQRDAEQRRLVRAVEASDSIIQITDRSGNIVYTNPAFTRYTGYTREEVLGRNPRFLHRAGETITDFSELWRTLLSGKVWTGSFCNRSKSGEILWEDATLSPIRNENGEIEHIVAVKENVNEKRALLYELETHKTHLEQLVAQRTAEVQASECRLRLILESTADSLIGTDVEGDITFINPSACDLLGYQPEELIGRNVHTAIHYQHANGNPFPVAECVLSNAIRTGKELRIEDGALWHKAGHAIPVSMATHPILEGNRVSGGVLSFIDISTRRQIDAEREAARTAAEKLAQIKSEFLANMSHEIRTPLNGVLGLAQIGYRDNHGLDKTRDTFARILDSGKLLLTIINDILDFSKIEAGKLEIESTPFDPAYLVGEAIDAIKVTAAVKNLILAHETASDLPKACLGDPVRIVQILLNLLSNAIKFTAKGEIRVSAGRDNNKLVFQVSDNGIGINPEQIDRLFQAFEQADGTTTRKYGGTGLGLTISRRLAELMDGSLSVRSSPGHGSTFTLHLPLVETDQPVVSGRRIACAESHRLAGLRILAAEDNPVNQLVLGDFLKQEGAEVRLVDDGQMAVDAIAQGELFDIVLMDVQMPVMDGITATHKLRQIAPALPVIGQTAHAMKEEHDKCLAAGMVATITKPLDVDVLVATVLERAKTRDGSPTVSAIVLDEDPLPRNHVVDWDALANLYPDRPEFIDRLVAIALQNYAKDADNLRTLIKDGDLQEICRKAHNLKGMAGALHAPELFNASLRVMEAESQDTLDQARALVIVVERLIEDVRQGKPK
jgi:two-component system sensor histidine kinase/response regulator